MSAAAEPRRPIPVERTCELTPDIFEQRYLSGSCKPVIVTGAMDRWPALSKWTFDFLKSRYGAETVSPSMGPGSKGTRMTKLRDYIDYLDAPEGPSPGFWVDPETGFPFKDPPEPPTAPLYLKGWNAFDRHPELLDDIALSPRFVEDWLPLLPKPFRRVLDEATSYFSAALMLGPAGSLSRLHQDFLHSHGSLAQIAGRKLCVLFSPEDSEAVYWGEIDPDRPDFDRFPLFRNATAFECILEPGEFLFIPCNWWHHVVGLEKCITISYNFFNRVNFGAYLTDLLQIVPTIADGLERLPDAKAALGIHWMSKGFECPVSGKQ